MIKPTFSRALFLLTTLAVCSAAVSCGEVSEETAIEQAETRTLVGVLQSDETAPAPAPDGAPAAEEARTGWVVVEEGTEMSIPVDLSAVIGVAQRMSGSRVAVEGVMTERPDPAGEQHFVFVAQTIELATEPAAGPDPAPR